MLVFFPNFWAFVGWLSLVHLGLEGLGVFVVLVCVFFCFVQVCFCLFWLCFCFCCWIVVGAVLIFCFVSFFCLFVSLFFFVFWGVVIFFLIFCLEGLRVR